MSNRCIVSVAAGLNLAGEPYAKGLARLIASPLLYSTLMTWRDALPHGSPSHQDVPYAFKAYALKTAADQGFDTLLWCDACIVPGARSFNDLWEKIETQGYWFSRNGYWNSEWTAESAYADLGVTHEENAAIPHVVATAFGLSLKHSAGREFLDEYFRLAQTKAFCGPWSGGIGVQHRHDQTAAGVLAWRLKMQLTDPPEWFAYRKGETEKTVLVADGNY